LRLAHRQASAACSSTLATNCNVIGKHRATH